MLKLDNIIAGCRVRGLAGSAVVEVVRVERITAQPRSCFSATPSPGSSSFWAEVNFPWLAAKPSHGACVRVRNTACSQDLSACSKHAASSSTVIRPPDDLAALMAGR
jgi:hypothetical protein